MDNHFFEMLPADEKAAEMLRDFIPKRVFDAHCHFYAAETIPQFAGPEGVFPQERSGAEDYIRHMSPLLPGAEVIRLNMIPMLDPSMRKPEVRERANGHILEQVRLHPEHTGSVYILPTDSEETLGAMVSQPGVGAMKCYCYGVEAANYNACAIGDFLPESAWVVSSRTGVPIILHMMRAAALADPDNLSYIKTMAKRYPDARLILAHCARAFSSWTVVDTVRELVGLDNIWFDVSAVCESAPMAACIMHTAGKRVMWGSDYPICMHRGRVVSLVDGMLWLMDDDAAKIGLKPARIAAENLLAFRQTCHLLNLDQTQIEDLFYNNAVSLFCKENG